jgi:hypothetical protein
MHLQLDSTILCKHGLGSGGKPLIIRCDRNSNQPLDSQSKTILENLLSARLSRSVRIEAENHITAPDLLLTVAFPKQGSIIPGKERLRLTDFPRKISEMNFDFRIEMSCGAPGLELSQTCASRISAVKDYLIRSAKLDAEKLIGKVSAPGQKEAADQGLQEFSDSVSLRVIQRL